jgi:hypothetical protein
MRTYDLVISVCWIVFLTVWAVAALFGGASRRYSATGSLLLLVAIVMAMMIGTSLVYPVAGIATVIMLVYFLYSARREERDMQRLFPDTYADYKRRSKMLVPFVF